MGIWCQFHQHFTGKFFAHKRFFICLHFCFVTFWHKNIGVKGLSKMLMEMTPGIGDLAVAALSVG